MIKNRKKLLKLNANNKRKLNIQKIYVNKLLYLKYRKLPGKWNALYKDEKDSGFYPMNSKIKIKIIDYEDDVTISHELDLSKVFGEATMQPIEEERVTRDNN